MAGGAIQIKVNDRLVKQNLADLLGRMRNKRPGLKIIGQIIRTSVVRNFEKGGRPQKWKPLKKATLAQKKGNKILINKGFDGGLLGSINVKATESSVSVGTNKKYAAIHQIGGTIKHPAHERIIHFKTFKAGPRKGKTLFSKANKASHGMKTAVGAYNIKIPARPYLLVQDEDWPEMRAALNDFLLRGKR